MSMQFIMIDKILLILYCEYSGCVSWVEIQLNHGMEEVMIFIFTVLTSPGFDCDLVSSLPVWKLDRKNPNAVFIMPPPNTIDLDHIASEGQSDQGHLSFQKLCWSLLAGKINTKMKKTPYRQLKWIMYKM